MSKIEEILRSHYSNREVEGLYHQFELLEMVAHEYAEWYAKKCLESAAIFGDYVFRCRWIYFRRF